MQPQAYDLRRYFDDKCSKIIQTRKSFQKSPQYDCSQVHTVSFYCFPGQASAHFTHTNNHPYEQHLQDFCSSIARQGLPWEAWCLGNKRNFDFYDMKRYDKGIYYILYNDIHKTLSYNIHCWAWAAGFATSFDKARCQKPDAMV